MVHADQTPLITALFKPVADQLSAAVTLCLLSPASRYSPQLQVSPRLVFHTTAAAETLSPPTAYPQRISNLVNLAEKVSGVDIDRDGDIGQRTSNESGAVTSHTLSSSVSSAGGLPVFDAATPKVSILAIGKNTLESANELLVAAEKRAAEFQPQATLKADFMLTLYVGAGNPNPPVSSCPRA
eukprot:scaffold13451_cov54-Phaeocystis_antarctica.AAC.2